MPKLTRLLNTIEQTIRNLSPFNRKQEVISWVGTRNRFLKDESKFKTNIRYSAGDVILVEFGYNVGAEFKGEHPAIVIEDSPRSAKTLMVVPLSSLEPGENIHPANVLIGELKKFNQIAKKKPGTISFAVMNQVRAIDKVRIKMPSNKFHERTHVDPDKLKEIYNKFQERYLSKGLDRKKPDES